MKRVRALLLILLVIVSILPFSACKKEKDDGKGYVFGYGITNNPGSLDPQCADDEESFMLIELLFEGLVKTDNSGNILMAGAESYDVSPDGKTYTFKLRENSYWTDKNGFSAECTADDYVYAFRRLFLPETRAAHAEDFFAIKNSSALRSKKITDASAIGVTAKDKYTLVIELEYEEPSFLMKLTTAAAKPCNEEYFIAAQGKYGLSAKATPSNGAFFLKSWNYDEWSKDNNNLVLRFSEKYSEYNEVCPLGLNFFIDDSKTHIADFEGGTIQNLLLKGSEAKKYIDSGYKYEGFSSESAGFIFNTESSVFKDSNLRLALVYAVDRDNISQPFGYKTAYGVVPECVTIDGRNYREEAGNSVNVKCDAVKAEALYRKAAETADKEALTSVRIIAQSGRDDDLLPVMQSVMQMWQGKVGFYCSIVFLERSEYYEAIKSGSYEIALVSLSANENRPESFLSQFCSGSYRYTVPQKEFSGLVKQSLSAKTAEESISISKSAEKSLILSGTYMPLSYGTVYFVGAKDSDNVIYNPFRRTIDYTKALYYE